MTNEQLRLRYIAAINRHWRSSLDKSGPTPGLLDDLVTIAEDHAVTHAGRVTARQALRAEAATTAAEGMVVGYKVGDDLHHPSDVTVVRSMEQLEPAADTEAAGGGSSTEVTVTPGNVLSRTVGTPASHRTRTRTRRTAD